MLKKGQVWVCPVCNVEVMVLNDARNTAPLTCCAVDMELKQ